MSTNATITLNTNTEDASTKDDTGMSAKPTVNSKSWQVQVDTLDVSDVGAMLTAIKSLTPFTLMWDEVATSDNQTPQGAAFARTGTAFLTDFTATFNDRENSAKNLQFSGSGPLSTMSAVPSYEAISAGSYTKGQFVRMFLGSDNSTTPSTTIAGCKQLSVHVSLSIENSSTKDTTGDWLIQEPTALNFDISTSALVRSGDTITSAVGGKSFADLETIYENSTPVRFQIANVSGDNNRTKGAVIMSGSVILASLTNNNPNRQNSDYSANFNGYGDYTVGS